MSAAGWLAQGAAQVIPEGGLAGKLELAEREGRPLRVKLGIDPTGADLTLGHAVVLRKLRQFQDAGHLAVLVVGDFTGQVGDPTGRTGARGVLTPEQVRGNARTYLEQALLILREDRLETWGNSQWLAAMTLADVLAAGRALTVAQLLERDDFARRRRDGVPITLTEFLYPMLQGLDSVAVAADCELGGTDQVFNCLAGRDLQRNAGRDPQVVMTMPLLRGTDGTAKMSKSAGNWISLRDTPDDKYGKVMSIPDNSLAHYAELCCAWTAGEVSQVLAGHPMDAKHAIARRITGLYHGDSEAAAAQDRWTARFSRREAPVDVPEFALPAGATVSVPDVLLAAGLVASKGEARRLLASGGIRLGGVKLPAQPSLLASEAAGQVLQRGKLRAVRLVARRAAECMGTAFHGPHEFNGGMHCPGFPEEDWADEERERYQ